ncbi:recombination directionality factor [Mycolicibacterium gilvum]|uniref:recombination directionality factor n=1 Tax=Mycolicibacterium gilvum TaxID=1804 RepID=UPI004045C610
MAILDLQRRIAEVGRIRIGQQVPSGNGRSRPEKLATFRLTSPNRVRVDQAAQRYGGTVAEWDAPAGKQWEVVTQADALNVIVPPSDMAFSQYYELWSAGGCQRRCDGFTESLKDQPCVCDPDQRECSIHTRLSVMLGELPGLGVWRIDTSGYYAAVELQGAVSVVQMAAGRGQMLPAQLRLEQRMVKRGGKTMRFAVPVLDVEISPAQLISPRQDTVLVERDTGRVLDSPKPPALTPVPETVQERPTASVAEQATAEPKRRRPSQPVPSTGLMPRTAAQATAGDEAITKPQLQKLSILRQENGYADTDEGRADWFRWVETNISRTIGSNKDLTKAEASVLIDVLETVPAE